MTLFEFIDPLGGFLLGVLHRLTESVPPLVSPLGYGILVRPSNGFRSVFSVAPRFLGRTFGLIDNSLTG